MIYFTLKMYVNTYGKMERTGRILVYTIYLVVNSHYGKRYESLRADDKVNKNNNEVRDEAIKVISIKEILR